MALSSLRALDCPSLHSKAAILDGERVFIGSLNFDPRSVWWNAEVGILVESAELAREVHRLTLEGKAPAVSYEVLLRETETGQQMVWRSEEDGELVLLEREPGGLWRRFNAWGPGSWGWRTCFRAQEMACNSTPISAAPCASTAPSRTGNPRPSRASRG